MSQPDVLKGYAADAAALIPAYEALATPDVLAPVLALLPVRPSRILDIGAGTGRDAAYLAGKGHHVVAVEPVAVLRDAAMALHPDPQIRWVDDDLPALARVRAAGERHDLILVIGVWQHLPANEHRDEVSTLADLLASGGRLIVSLRHGTSAPARPCFRGDPDRIVEYAVEVGLRVRMRADAGSLQQANRDLGVSWTWLCFEQG